LFNVKPQKSSTYPLLTRQGAAGRQKTNFVTSATN